MTVDIKTLIKAPVANVFRRAYIKRRQLSTATFESDWVEITDDVKSFGKITNQIDAVRRNKFTFGNAKINVENENGRYNPHDVSSSLWYGYLNQQRTLVKLEVGFYTSEKNDSGVWVINEFPSKAEWDSSAWDEPSSVWDADQNSVVFNGVISGDITLSDSNQVSLNVKPLTSVFQDFPARNLTGWTSTGLTASQFVQMIRDQTDGSGSYIFRPFFGDTTANWIISTTSNILANLNTSGAKDVIDRTVWEVIEKLAEAENFVPFVNRDGAFNFVSRSSVETATSFEFHGAGSFDTEYGHTIKSVQSYGFRLSKYYSRVQIKWVDEDTSTSYVVSEATITVSATNNPWVLGVRTLSIENFYIPTSTVAATLAQAIFDDVSSVNKEIEFTTSLIPHLDLFNRFNINYDPSGFSPTSVWDQNNWAQNTSTSNPTDLIFDSAEGDSIILQGEEFKFLSFEIDLDNLTNKFTAREV